MLSSRALLSIGMFVLLGNLFLNPKALPTVWKRFLDWKPLLFLTTIFFVYALSGLWSEDTSEFLVRMRVKLPFLVLPLAAMAIPTFEKRVWLGILYFFFGWMTLACLYTLVKMLPDLQDIAANYAKGQVFETPINHIRFSLLVVLAVASGFYLIGNPSSRLMEWRKWALGLGILIMAATLHIIAVRSGLLCFYLLLAYSWFRFYFNRKRILQGLGLLLVCLVIGFLAVQYVPTLNNRVKYTLWSLEQIGNEEWLKHTSDPKRIASIHAGWQIGMGHPLTGVGVGDVKAEAEKYFEQKYPQLVGLELLPHNQYLFVFAAMGWIGVVFFVWTVLYPIWFRKGYQDYFLVAFQLILLTSFLVEMTLETQFGTAIYLIFLLLSIRFLVHQYEASLSKEEGSFPP